ncbi:MAG TPA: hypothetical protein VLL72_04540 [Kiloniellales bacterium]|nr:hypothetical protein [Kiloniellales bacterium]
MRSRSLLLLSTMVAAGLLLAACDESEQGRVLMYDKGTYLGQPDNPLTEDEQEALRARTRMQQGS